MFTPYTLTYAHPLLSQWGSYIINMEKESNDDNLADFTAYKLRALVEELARNGDLEDAEAMQYALDSYLLGDTRICFIDGWPYIIAREDTDMI